MLVFGGMTIAAMVARDGAVGPDYRRLALGFLREPRDPHDRPRRDLAGALPGRRRLRHRLDSAVRVLSVGGGRQRRNRRPVSMDDQSAEPTPSRPWVVFAAIALIPVLDLALRPALPLGVARRATAICSRRSPCCRCCRC